MLRLKLPMGRDGLMRDRRPVMFYLHGGGFNQGSGNDYKGQPLVNHSAALESPVAVVTINYRLSFFGFLGKYV